MVHNFKYYKFTILISKQNIQTEHWDFLQVPSVFSSKNKLGFNHFCPNFVFTYWLLLWNVIIPFFLVLPWGSLIIPGMINVLTYNRKKQNNLFDLKGYFFLKFSVEKIRHGRYTITTLIPTAIFLCTPKIFIVVTKSSGISYFQNCIYRQKSLYRWLDSKHIFIESKTSIFVTSFLPLAHNESNKYQQKLCGILLLPQIS